MKKKMFFLTRVPLNLKHFYPDLLFYNLRNFCFNDQSQPIIFLITNNTKWNIILISLDKTVSLPLYPAYLVYLIVYIFLFSRVWPYVSFKDTVLYCL